MRPQPAPRASPRPRPTTRRAPCTPPPPTGALAGAGTDEGEGPRARAREQIPRPGDYPCYEEGGEVRTVALAREWTRIGRSLAADVRFDDPTVSRRHALIVRQPDGVRVLDDRSLNGVFVNRTRVEGRVLRDGDEIVVGRSHRGFLTGPAAPATSSELEATA